MHKHGFLHRDLKLDNILLSRGENGRLTAKLGDFGSSKKATYNVTGTLKIHATSKYWVN